MALFGKDNMKNNRKNYAAFSWAGTRKRVFDHQSYFDLIRIGKISILISSSYYNKEASVSKLYTRKVLFGKLEKNWYKEIR